VHTKLNNEALEQAQYFAFATHALNVRLRELNEIESNKYDRKWFNVNNAFGLKQVGVIALSENIVNLKGIQFFRFEEDAQTKLAKIINKKPDAYIIKIDVLTNVSKAEQKAMKRAS